MSQKLEETSSLMKEKESSLTDSPTTPTKLKLETSLSNTIKDLSARLTETMGSLAAANAKVAELTKANQDQQDEIAALKLRPSSPQKEDNKEDLEKTAM